MRKTVGGILAPVALVLVGCSAATPSQTDGAAADRAPDTAAFVACLREAGVEAKVGDEGYALVKHDSATMGGETGTGAAIGAAEDADATPGAHALFVMGESDGTAWVAAESSAYFADDPDTQDAYAACEERLPGFTQPEYDPFSDPRFQEFQEQVEEAGLAFARCARDAGFTWVRDPGPDTGGAIELPDDLTEDEFRGALEACYDPDRAMSWATSERLGFDFGAVLEELGPSSGISVIQGDGDQS